MDTNSIEERQVPPWMNVDPAAVVQQLTNQLAGMVQQLAMRDAYIAQLHEALMQMQATVGVRKTEDTNGHKVPEGAVGPTG